MPLPAEFKALLRTANIPPRAEEQKLDQYPTGATIMAYLNGPNYRDDRTEGRGISFYGEAANRVFVFPVIARAMCLKLDLVYYCSLQVLANAVTEDNHPAFDKIAEAKALFVYGMYDHSIPLPITGIERHYVEVFLRERSEGGLRNYYSLSHPMLTSTWWSEEFRFHQHELTRSMSLDT